jgi:hypothetical protein
MFITFLVVFVVSIPYLTFRYYEYELAECETERQALIASIEQLSKTSQRIKPRKKRSH